MYREMVVHRRLLMGAGGGTDPRLGSPLREVSPTDASSATARCVFGRLAWAGIFCWALISVDLLQGHAAYAGPPNGAETTAGESIFAADLKVSINAGRLTLHAENASMTDVLAAIGQQAGFKISIQGEFDQTVTESFENEPLNEAVADLLWDTSFVMIYGKAPVDGGPPQLVEITVNSRSANQVLPVIASVGDYSEDQSEAAISNRRAVMLGLNSDLEDEPELFAELAGLEENRRLYAMQWLADQGDGDAISILGRFLALDNEPSIRTEAALVLGDIGSEAASQSLALGLGDGDPDVRFQVVEAIGGAVRPDTTLLLGQVLFGEVDPEVRMSALAGLGRSRSEAAWVFIEAAAEDHDPEVRKIANDLLATWGLEN